MLEFRYQSVLHSCHHEGDILLFLSLLALLSVTKTNASASSPEDIVLPGMRRWRWNANREQRLAKMLIRDNRAVHNCLRWTSCGVQERSLNVFSRLHRR
jgi:hypothetical protein